MKPFPIIVSSPSGGGKTTVVQRLLRRDKTLRRVVTATTRGPRDGEKNGRDYHFWTEKQFQDAVKKGQMLEWAKVHAHYYGIPKVALPEKLFGVYRVRSLDENEPLLRGMNDIMHIPMSRHTAVDEVAVAQCREIKVLAVGDQCGLSIAKSKDNKKFFFTGHSEYDRFTLRSEYLRDLDKGLPIKPPVHYFIDGDVNRVNMKWRSTATLLFNNWLNYVYQVTPYVIN